MRTPSFDPGIAGIALLFALAPAMAVGGALGMTVLLTLAGLACLRPSSLRSLVENRPLFMGLLALFVGWTTLSALWSPAPEAPLQAAKIAVTGAAGLCLVAVASGPGARLAGAGAAAAAIILCGLMGIEAASGFILNRAAQPDVDPVELIRHLSRAGAFLAVMVWAGAGFFLNLAGRAWVLAAAALIVAAGALSPAFGATANLAAFAAGLAAFVLAYAAPRAALIVAASGLAAWLLLAPVLTPLMTGNASLVEAMPFSWASRAAMWDYTIDRIWEGPIWGHGLEAARAVTDVLIVQGEEVDAMSNHPHSFSLQVWYELGGVGALIGAATLVVGGLWLARAYGERRAAAAVACATLASAGVITNVSFSAWAEWWVATLFIAVACVGAIGAWPAPSSRALD